MATSGYSGGGLQGGPIVKAMLYLAAIALLIAASFIDIGWEALIDDEATETFVGHFDAAGNLIRD